VAATLEPAPDALFARDLGITKRAGSRSGGLTGGQSDLETIRVEFGNRRQAGSVGNPEDPAFDLHRSDLL